jgi:hypothetical protein
MKDFIRKPDFIRSLEFWTATSIFLVAVFFRITAALTGDTSGIPILNIAEAGTLPPNFYSLYFFPQLLQYAVLYGAFLLMSLVIVPRLAARQSVVLHIILGLIITMLMGLGLGVLDTYLKHYMLGRFPTREEAHYFLIRDRMLYAVWLTLLFGLYTTAKLAGLYVLENLERLQQRYRFLSLESVLAYMMWVISMFFLATLVTDKHMLAIWAVFPPSAIVFYWYGTYLLVPKSLQRKKPFRAYMLRSFLALFAAFLPIGIITTLATQSPDIGFPVGVMNSVFQFLITAPVTWVLYMRSLKGAQELFSLREQLGRSVASIDFLRSQINPHFLFNALNTIYGTAIQEGAERTSEGVQRLGDMMRFMLQENMQEQIPLNREIEYLNNYISLQRLRTDPHPGIEIKADITEQVQAATIAPMLLIPFVENAFKHGISLRDPSYIKIALELNGNQLNFDVHNSKHNRAEGDPEHDKSGIGLLNVRQRLALLYPGRHELIIRETGKEYFIHLTLKLADQP